MKIHHLRITGIGPYAELQEIDFEPINDAGVHLLTGPTGSGKTTVLDAISYALFGEIPRAAKGAEVVSDHRDLATTPEVSLELTVGGSLLRITRSPQHLRPSSRGKGITNQKQTVQLELHSDDQWQTLSDRWTEANTDLLDRVGMNADQFSQVVMLPQGEFARFLRSDASSRKELLEKLFPGTDLTYVEDWLKKRSNEDSDRRNTKLREISDCVERVRPVVESMLDDEGEVEFPVPDISEAAPVIHWVGQTTERLEAVADSAEAQRKTAFDACEASDTELVGLRRRAELVSERARAEDKRDELGKRLGWREAIQEEIDAADRAAKVTPLSRQAMDLAAAASKAADRRDRLGKTLEEEPEVATSDPAQLTPLLNQKRAEMTTTVNFEKEDQPRRRTLDKRRKEIESELEQLDSDGPDSPVVKAKAGLDEVIEKRKALRLDLVGIRDTRTRGMAAELAAGLVDGEPCVVCGSTEHPSPAHGEGVEYTRDDEAAAEKAADDAEKLETLKRTEYEALRVRVETRKAELATEIRGGEDELKKLADRESALSGGAVSLAARHESLEDICGTIDTFLTSDKEAQKDRDASEKMAADAAEAAEENGFDGLEAAKLASREAAALDSLRKQATGYDTEVSKLQGRLEGDLVGIDRKEKVDLAPVEAANLKARELRDQKTGLAATAADRLTTFRTETTPLARFYDELAPLREAAARSDSLSRLTSGDNARRMKLSIFVLAARLQQVIHEANRHLEKMSDRRYELVYSGDLAGHGATSGLGIEVFDAYTSETRPTGTLSGGESFYASLALALGLAEVVQQEAGGRRLETLFIDEGFGTLDGETLDHVMVVIDSLRDGGRSVGLVSHVEELRNRIQVQIQVNKGRQGSTIEVAGL